MKRIIVPDEETIHLQDVDTDTPIFAVRDGKLAGLVVAEAEKGWILRIGGGCGADGFFQLREKCMIKGIQRNYTFVTDLSVEDCK